MEKEQEDKIIDLILGQLHLETPNMINFKIIKKSGIDIPLGYDNEIIDKITHFEKLIERPNKNRNEYVLTEKGVNVVNENGFSNYNKNKNIQLKLQKEKDALEFYKSKVDLKLAKETLKEFPKTKKRAKVAYIIAIILAVVQLAQWIITLLPKD